MKFRIFYLIALTLPFFVSCKKEDDNKASKEHEQRVMDDYITTYYPSEIPSSTGLYYLPTKEGDGLYPVNITDYVYLNFWEYSVEYLTLMDTSIDTLATEENLQRTMLANGGPLKLSLGEIQYNIPGLYEGLLKMKEGGKARMIMPSSIANTNYVPVYYDVELLKVAPDPHAFEMQQLSKYLADNYQKTLNDSTKDGQTGIFLLDTIPGTGNYPNADDTVTCKYTLKSMPYNDGKYLITKSKIIDQSSSFTVHLGQSEVVKGFEGALSKIRLNGKATVIIPYWWGYGTMSNVNNSNQITILPYSTLIFEIEVTKY